MRNISHDFFWPSYVDLLTALFIVMLVMFVLSYKLLSDSKKVTEEELKKIKEIQKISESLPTKYFEFQPEYKRWTLKQPTQFGIGSDEIPRSDYEYLEEVGNSLVKMLNDLNEKYKKDSLKYLIVIEGMSSKIGTNPDPNYLSYRRAKSLVEFWEKRGINIKSDIFEILVVGSGIEGVGRYEYDPPFFDKEKKNQRILIQIIPKISKID
ncbi:MAG: hypothetical protein ACUVQP_11320 [Bacteroidales bacterium]